MGQICAGKSAEPVKQSTFSDQHHGDNIDDPNSAGNIMQVVDTTPSFLHQSKDQYRDVDSERQRAVREEQDRLERIVLSAGRDMVAIRSTRGGSYYNDQGFAAALAQYLEKTMESVAVTKRLPRSQGDALYSILSRPIETYPDTQAESFLSLALPVKEQLFAGCKPIVENLL